MATESKPAFRPFIPASSPLREFTARSLIVGTLLGAAAGAIIGSATGQAGQGAAIGAGTGLLFGSAAGSNAYGYSYYEAQRRYDMAYAQCMYARGNQLPGQVVQRRLPVYSYPPPNYPPPPGVPAPRG